jgi:tetratricopeptide (TPR) repeat protein
MFEMGREIRRLFTQDVPRDGLSMGDAGLLELLDLALLKGECRSADIAAGRISARDRPQRLLESAMTWREFARRSGDAVALRKSASLAEESAAAFKAESRPKGAARARCEQALVAIAGAQLFAEDGLNAAAEYVLAEIAPGSDFARGALAGLTARGLLGSGELDEVLSAARTWNGPLAGLDAHGRDASGGLAARRLRCERAEFLTGCGARLHAPVLFELALKDLDKAGRGLDPAYRPLSHARVQELRGLAMTGLGEALGDAAPMLQAVDILDAALEALDPGHSPMDWARLHNARAQALLALGEAGDCEAAFDKAIAGLGQALGVLDGSPGLALRATVAQNRASALVRRAELDGDVLALDEAEAIFRCELAALKAPVDPVAWAVVQMNLARIYRARGAASGRPHEAYGRAGEALTAALDVFGEHGLRTLAAMADRELDTLRDAVLRLAG